MSFQGEGQSASGVQVPGDSQFAWNWGIGIDVIPQRNIAVRFEYRDYFTSIPVYHTSGLRNMVPSIGIVFRFNRIRKL
jgi:opacity protein-like surface antigen